MYNKWYNSRYLKQSVAFTLTVTGMAMGIFYYRDFNRTLRMKRIERESNGLPEMKSIKDFEKEKETKQTIENINNSRNK